MLLGWDRARRDAIVARAVGVLVLLGFVAAGVTARVWGQTSVDGAISGVVVDSGGAAVAGAIVRAKELSTWSLVGRRVCGGARAGGGVFSHCRSDRI
jgi:hypothetical protein